MGPELRAPHPAQERGHLLVAGGPRLQHRAGVVGRHARAACPIWRRGATSASSRTCSAAPCGRSAAAGFALDRSAGLDVKAGLTPSLTLDATVNPDFAQAEADEQQVNLTQFSLFFPEKREFFLENSGVFYFGDIPRNQRQTSRFRPPEEDLLLFFSRRIGLTDGGAQVPLYGGLRVTGRAGNYGLGALSMQSEATGGRAGQNYSVARVRRDVFGNADVGAIVMSRQSASDGNDYNRVVGVDANFRVFKSLSLNGFAARSDTPG